VPPAATTITGNFSIALIPAADGEAACAPERLGCARDSEFEVRLRLTAPAAEPLPAQTERKSASNREPVFTVSTSQPETCRSSIRVCGAPKFSQALSRTAVQDWVLSFEIPRPMSAVTETCRSVPAGTAIRSGRLPALHP
jgi:hypothetical protein